MMRQQIYSFNASERIAPWNINPTVPSPSKPERRVGRFMWADPRGIVVSPLPEWPAEDVTTSLTRQINDLLWRLRQQGVRLNRPEEIQEYLLLFPDTIEALEETVKCASKVLVEAQLGLEVYRDPEIQDQHLVLYARLKTYPENVMEQIRIAREKSRGYLLGKKGWLHLTTDFRPAE